MRLVVFNQKSIILSNLSGSSIINWNFLPSLYSTCTTVYHLQQNRAGSEPRAPPKKFFWSNPYEIELMVTSLIEMTELPNFGRMTTSTI